MFLEGHIIEFLDVDQLRPGYVRKQERDRLQVIDPRGRNLSVPGDRVIVVHQQTPENDFPEIARNIVQRVQARQLEVDLELLWQSLEGSLREQTPEELARLFFSDSSPEAVSAVFRALVTDTLFFKRSGSQFIPKTPQQVLTEQQRRHRQIERDAQRERLSETLTQLARGKPVTNPGDLEGLLDRLHNWMRHKTGDEAGTMLEQMVGIHRARDAAFDILVRGGRLDASQDRFLATAGIEPRFPDPLVEAANAVAAYAHDPARLDYREAAAVTIDDEDTLEVDDGISLRRENDEFVVGLHIADVSAFVPKGHILDAEAARRCSTIYLPSSAVRMFPEHLSTNVASLRAGVERPAFTVEVRFDENFNRLGYRIAVSTVCIRERLSYDQADERIRREDPALTLLHRIALHLQETRAGKGAITFRRPELKIRLNGGELEVRKLDPNAPSRILVSEMMILMNGLAADFASANSLPVIFRTQEARDAVAVEEGPAIEALAFERLRKTFKRSRLSLSPGVHSGLGLTAYTQVSSPIRRYADLVTQRQFTAMLAGTPVPYNREELLQIIAAAEAAEQEIRGIEERSSTYWLLVYLGKEKSNQAMDAVVIDGKSTVELEDFYLRGRLSDSANLAPGTRVQVRIENLEPVKGDIRFKRA